MHKVKASLVRDGTDEARSIYNVVTTMVEQQCGFCDGFGHNALKCTTKKALDRALRSLQLGGTWGRIKSKVLAESYARLKTETRLAKMAARNEARIYMDDYESDTDQEQLPITGLRAPRTQTQTNLNTQGVSARAPSRSPAPPTNVSNQNESSQNQNQGVTSGYTFNANNTRILNAQIPLAKPQDREYFSNIQESDLQNFQRLNFNTSNFKPGTRGDGPEQNFIQGSSQPNINVTPTKNLVTKTNVSPNDFKATGNQGFVEMGPSRWDNQGYLKPLKNEVVRRQGFTPSKQTHSVKSRNISESHKSFNTAEKVIADINVTGTLGEAARMATRQEFEEEHLRSG